MHSVHFKKIVRSSRVLLGDELVPAAIVVSNDGAIAKILREPDLRKYDVLADEVLDVRDLVILPGVVDSHVHLNEPGRTEWEGFATGTQAAVAGGVTTIVDMPLNSIPPTTTVNNFKTKLKAANGQLHCDVAFWGGLVPDNKESLLDLLKSGVVGFKCFLCPSGVDEFPKVTKEDVIEALSILKGTDAVLAFHAEVEGCSSLHSELDPQNYESFLETRPPSMEIEAVQMVSELCQQSQVRCHVVHASSSHVLDIVAAAKAQGAPLTAETCHHYLTLDSSLVPRGATSFKCCPPIRDPDNRAELWRHLTAGNVDLVVSDHSPSPPELKQSGDFLTAWGGVSSVQFGLSLIWTEAKKRNIPLATVSRLLSANPAQLAGLKHKGGIVEGKDADLIVFDPEEDFLVTEKDIYHRHKLTPYLGMSLKGRVQKTLLRGEAVFEKNAGVSKPLGNIILKKGNV